MLKVLKKTLEIDIAYSVNSFIYVLKKLPILKDLLTEDEYQSKALKKIVGLIGIILSLTRALINKFIYFLFIFLIVENYFKNNQINAFFHIYFFLTIIGMFINNKLLNTSKKTYFAIELFNIDANKYLKAITIYNQITMIISNTICMSIILLLLGKFNIIYLIEMLLLNISTRIIGEAFNIKYYKKYNYIWYSNTKLYFTVLVINLLLALLPFINIFMPHQLLDLFIIILLIISIPCLIYIFNIEDFKLLFKRLFQVTKVMNSENNNDYLRQAMVEVQNKDKIIDNKKIQNKKGYDLFNTIFFERHKEILLRSAKKYSAIIVLVYIFLFYQLINNNNYQEPISTFITKNIVWFIAIMCMTNRGSIVTQAMFFNCDHAMLRYNFYKEKNTIYLLFKKRLITIIKVNLLPAIFISLGNIGLLYLTNNLSLSLGILYTIYIFVLSILFSTHYLVLYYLLQPYNKDMEIKKTGYMIVTYITYILTYGMIGVSIAPISLIILTTIFTVIYCLIGIILVKKYSYKTFKLN